MKVKENKSETFIKVKKNKSEIFIKAKKKKKRKINFKNS